MKPSIRMKSLLASSAYYMGLLSLNLARAPRSDFIILMYHRIIPKNEAQKGIQAGMYVETGTFECHIRFLRKYFSIRPISEIFSKSSGSLNDKPSCALTFDDGWYDFYTNCFPVLKDYEVPAMVFLPTDFIGSHEVFWTDRLSSLLSQRFNQCGERLPNGDEALTKKPFLRTLLAQKGSYESRLESAIAQLKTLRSEEIEKTITELSSTWGIKPQLSSRSFLSWEEVSEMGKTGLIGFGSHTATHRILTTLEKEEVKEELIKSKEALIARKATDPSFIAFSYPNGDYNEEIYRLVKDAGYRLAVTTKKGWNQVGVDPFLVNRFPIHQDMTSSAAMLSCRIIGFF